MLKYFYCRNYCTVWLSVYIVGWCSSISVVLVLVPVLEEGILGPDLVVLHSLWLLVLWVGIDLFLFLIFVAFFEHCIRLYRLIKFGLFGHKLTRGVLTFIELQLKDSFLLMFLLQLLRSFDDIVLCEFTENLQFIEYFLLVLQNCVLLIKFGPMFTHLLLSLICFYLYLSFDSSSGFLLGLNNNLFVGDFVSELLSLLVEFSFSIFNFEQLLHEFLNTLVSTLPQIVDCFFSKLNPAS